MLVYFLQGLPLGLSAAATPGPYQAYLLAQSIRNGWKKTLPATLAPLTSDGPVIILVFLVLREISPLWLNILQLAGGLFLLYLAWGAAKALRQRDTSSSQPERETTGLLKATLINLTSPGPWLYWSLISGPILLAAWRETPTYGIAFLVGFYIILLTSNALLVIVFGTMRQFGPRVVRILTALSAAALSGFGLYYLISAVIALGIGTF